MLGLEVIPVGTLGVEDNPVMKDTLEVNKYRSPGSDLHPQY
jgi:hypothetical protein